MARIEEIRRLSIKSTTEGVRETTAEVSRLAEAQEGVATATGRAASVTDAATRSLLSAEQALHRQRLGYDTTYAAQNRMEKALAVLDQAFKQNILNSDQLAAEQEKIAARFSRSAGAADELTAAQRRLNAEQKASAALSGLGSASAAFASRQNANERANSLMSSLGQAPAIIDQTAASTKLATHEVTNLAAQVSDIGISLAGGQSPFLVMAQQGSQISQVMGKRGVTEIIGAVGTALMSLVTPTTLVLGGLVIGGYAVATAFDALSGSADDVEERLKTHEAIVQRIADRYGDARDKAIEFSEARHLNDIADARENLDALRKSYEQAEQAMMQGIAKASVSVDSAGNIVQTAGYEAFADVIAKASAEAQKGMIDVEGFRAAVWEVMETSSEPAVKQLGEEFRTLGAAAQGSVDGVLEAEGAVNKVQSTLGATVAMMDKFRDAMKNWDKDQRTLADMQERLGSGSDPRKQFVLGEVGKLSDTATEADIAKAREYAAAIYDQTEAQKQANEAARDAENRQKQLDRAYERAKAQVDDYVRDLELQAETFGMAAGEAERLRVRQALLTSAQRAGREATADLTAEIEGYADRAARATENQETLQKRQDAFNDSATAYAQLGSDAFSGLISGGREFGDILTDLTDKLLEMELQSALLGTGPLAGLFGTAGTNGAPGGILGSLVTGVMGAFAPAGNAAGTDNWRGGLSIVGEHGPEVLNLPQGSQVSPTNDVFGAMKAMASMAAAGGGSQVNVTVQTLPGTTVDVRETRGADGTMNIAATVRKLVEDEMVSQAQGRGRGARALEQSYGLRKRTA